ncbi:MAG TPA: acetyl-CoA carboxylase carboxyl transferase subunit alpha, partial [Stellaceae bacterium]
LGIVDRIVAEPLGGAQRAPKVAVEQLGEAIEQALQPLLAFDGSTLRLQRREKFLTMGVRGL